MRKRNKWHIIAGSLLSLAIIIAVSLSGVIQALSKPSYDKIYKVMVKAGNDVENSVYEELDSLGAYHIISMTDTFNSIDDIDKAEKIADKFSSVGINSNIQQALLQVMTPYELGVAGKYAKLITDNIGEAQLISVMKAVIADAKKGYDYIIDNAAYSDSRLVIGEGLLINGFNVFMNELYKDSQVLPYISLIELHKLTRDQMTQIFTESVKNMTITVSIDNKEDESLHIDVTADWITAQVNIVKDKENVYIDGSVNDKEFQIGY